MASEEFVLDPKYEFSAPRYHDFVAGESKMDIDEAEHWFESARGYEDSPHADKANGSEAVPSSAMDDIENMAPAPVKVMPATVIEVPKPSPLKEISVNVVDCPSTTTPFKRPLCSNASKHGQALTAPKNSMRSLTRYARDTVVKKMKKSIEMVMGTDENANKKQKVETGCVKQGGKPGSPFMSLAEKVLKFQIKTPERFRNHSQQELSTSLLQHQKSALKLTVPKEPELETSHRARPPRVKSTAELEEEMLAKIPKFKARPMNKKIFEAPHVPAISKRNAQQPEFQEFHLRTTERALQHICSASEASVSDVNERRKSAPGDLREPREPQLHTAARARPTKVKSREEMEIEELQKVPKFKARPLNKKIFESRGDLGIFRSQKRQLTVPVEFHFATDERCQHPSNDHDTTITEKLEKEAHCPAGPTVPRPFHLVTEHRGEANKTRFMQELFERELEERNLRVPKANPLPFTTDIPAIPPKPQPKDCTRPEPFELESLVRHEEELQRKAEELARLELEEAAMRQFHAQPAPVFDFVFMPERSRAPLTEVQEFCFRAEARAAERAEFDKKVMEKQNHYKHIREELEAARRVEEGKLVKALRREMIPLARPMPVFGKPFVPHRSKREPTRAISPRLRVLDRKERRQSTQQRQSNERRRSVELRRASTMSAQKKAQMR
ncbi:protein TPX2 [Selaginella moellendorffii]|uniref:protein TPX2 n=1 Tax=Selaginella moellendorffii TaxID=88036 RepID=UPI000D1CA865|nr:protein TPX2 [Selaginella moellendorffii]|eukprot:XP_024545603.1 protein TPX2 [Selaginella moellendorffii]